MLQLSIPFQVSLSPSLANCPQAATLPTPISTSKHQVFLRAKWSIYCHIYLFSSYLTSVNYLLLDFHLFKYITDKFLYVVCIPSLIFPISSVVFITWFCSDFLGTHMLCYSTTICNLLIAQQRFRSNLLGTQSSLCIFLLWHTWPLLIFTATFSGSRNSHYTVEEIETEKVTRPRKTWTKLTIRGNWNLHPGLFLSKYISRWRLHSLYK